MNRSQRRRLRTRASLLAAMRSELSKSSVDDMVVHDVTERADVALGTFYNHFDDKSAGVEALAELEAAMMRRVTLEAVGSSDDLLRWASVVSTLLVQRAAADPPWITAIRALVDAQKWPTPNSTAFVTALLRDGGVGDEGKISWTVEVFQSVLRGLIRHLSTDGFDGPLEGRIETAVRTMCGALLVTDDDATPYVEFCVAIAVRTDWPDATIELTDDEDFMGELRATGAVAAGLLES